MADDSIRWLHLSDFHVGKDKYAQRRIFERILEHVRERVAAAEAPDLVFITGDLAQSGKAEEYTEFYDEFLLPLQVDALGDGWTGKIFTIPGNHDLDRSVARYSDRAKMCEPAARIFDCSAEGLQEREIQLLPRFKAYAESETKEGSDSPDGWLTSRAGAFGELLEVRGRKLGIVGVNTAWLCEDEHDRHRLTPGLSLLEDALVAVRGCEACIVLGHHPLDWLHDRHVEPMRALLGEHRALYLHGHLHEHRGRREDGAGHGFLAIQSGACFQARDGEPWVNGLLWAKLDLKNRELGLQPRIWNQRNLDWPLAGEAFPEHWRRSDWWCFPLPGTRSEKKIGRAGTRKPAAPPLPEGWQIIDRVFLDAERKALPDYEALRFFDGSMPSWRLALAEEIPRRKVVDKLTAKLCATPVDADLPTVVLLVGPGGEGKSMAVLQTIAALVDKDPLWKALWREDEDCALTADDVHALPTGAGERWLIATDDADLIADELFAAVKKLRRRGDVAFLLTCRDTDWRASSGQHLPWESHADFLREELSGLSAEDARRIVEAWSRYGEEGLGELAGQGRKEAARRLMEAAQKEAELKEGAFFGAMLQVRIGDALRRHLKTLLGRLQEREIHPGVTLLDAFAYIAAMHAEGLAFLSRPVLAQVLACEPRELKARVLGPLGKEAAAVRAGRGLLTRHRTIACCAVEVLAETFEWEIDELYPALAHAAKTARREQGFIPDLDPRQWEIDLPKHFLAGNRKGLALQIGRRLLDADPNNIRTRNNLASLYRKAGAPEEAARLFRNHDEPMDRSAWYEWGTAEGEAGNPIQATWLQAFSLADQAGGAPPDNKQAKLSLAGLGVTFANLFAAYNDRAFVEARAAIAVLGLRLPFDPKAHGYFEKYLRESHPENVPEMDVDTAFERFEVAMRALGELCDNDDPLVARCDVPEIFSFGGLRRLIDARRQR